MAKKKLTSTKARKILHDKEVHGHPLTEKQRKFFGAIAGGAEPYKAQIGTKLTSLPSNYMKTLSEALGFPQKAVTKMVTGKYQTPSEAMGITSPIGAFATDAVFDPVNLLGGAGFAKAASKTPKVAAKAAQSAKTVNSANRLNHLKELVKMRQEGVDLVDFFENLGWTPEGKQLWNDYLSKSNTVVLTGGRELAPGADAISTGKRAWAKKNLNLEGDKVIVEKQKAKYANPESILIDDLESNVNKFREAGGHAILHTDINNTIKQLQEHMMKNPTHKIFTDLDGVLVDLQGGVEKFRAPKKKDGGWLDKYEEGGVLKQKTHDNYGTKPNANDSDVSLPPGFVGMAYNTKGRNYSPAWGGQFQMGGSLPGAVGFTYARTAGAAPANGPYAKKTKASAQNGQEMKYYQEGLDFKPKTISQDGSNLRLIPRATGDLRGPKIDPRFAENVAAAKDRDAYSTFEELRSTPGLKLYSDEELAKLSKQDPSKWSKHVKQEYADRQSKKTLIQAHPDYNPEMSFEDQQGLLSDKSLRARVLRGKNLLTGSEYGPAPLAIANQIVTAPANLVSNLAFNPYEKYIRPGAAEGLTNVLSDVMDAIDPVNPGTFMKAALKAAPKTALKLSTALPFYKVLRTTDQAADASKQVFKSYVDRTKELLEQPSSKQAFKNLADKLSISRVRSADPSYVEAINDPTLPIEAVDKMVASLTALDPSEFALSKQQAKYTKELGSLATDMKGAGPVRSEVEGEQVVDWLTTNASNMSPRDLVPLLSNLTQNLDENSKLRLVKRLYDSRAGAASANPMARYTAAQDLFSLAENYQDIRQILQSTPRGQLSPSTFLGKNIATNIKNIISNVGHVRPMVKIDDPYFFQNAGNIGNAQEIFHSLFRNVSHGLPTQQERTAAREYVTKQITQRTKNLFNRPLRQNYQDESDFLNALSQYQSNVGMPFVGAHSMSTDSYELAQRALLMKDRLGFDILPIHGGTAMDAFPSYTNSFGGITRVGDLRSSYLEDLNKRIGQASLKTIDPASQQAYMSARYSIDPQTIHRALVESAFTNSVNTELNRQLGTNIPAAVYEGFRVNRPLLGFVPKKDGGDIPVDPMGYWNPENVGGPVTIPSNVITMEGVDQPLLGISDTGDVQYMMPGEDYEFDGEYVTEYPMAKKGISVNNADAQPLKKLDQLLNFTNYNKPTKGGWLDKYQ